MNRRTRGGLILVAVILTVGLISCVTGGMMGAGMRPGFGMGYGWGWPLGLGFGALAVCALWVGVLGGLYLLSRQGRLRLGGKASSSASPADIIKRRYAEGEITREQFEQMKTDLDG